MTARIIVLKSSFFTFLFSLFTANVRRSKTCIQKEKRKFFSYMKIVREQMRGSGGVFSGAHMMGFYPCWLRQSLGKGLVGFAFTVLCMISRWIFMSLAVTSRISTKRGFDIMLIVSFARFLTHRKGARKIQLEHQMQYVLNINSFKTPLWDDLQVHSNPADPSSTI